MAFCTNCGAQVSGAFCVQCGTPAKSSAGQAASSPSSPSTPAPQPAPSYTPQPAAPQAAPPYQGQPVPGAATVARKTSPIVWILIAVAGIFVLGIVGVVGTGFFLVHKAKQAGLDTDLMSRNPGLAATKLLATMSPDTEVLKTDDSAGTITVRDKKTGKITTITFDEINKGGKFRFTAQDEHGQTASMEIGGDSKLPSWVPNYPGASVKPQLTFKGDANNATGEAGSVSFS